MAMANERADERQESVESDVWYAMMTFDLRS